MVDMFECSHPDGSAVYAEIEIFLDMVEVHLAEVFKEIIKQLEIIVMFENIRNNEKYYLAHEKIDELEVGSINGHECTLLYFGVDSY